MLEYDLFKDENKIFFDGEKSKEFKISKELTQVLYAMNCANIRLNSDDVITISNADPDDLTYLALQIMPKYGEVFNEKFPSKDNTEEHLKQIIHYILRYGFGIDDHDYDLSINLSELINHNAETAKLITLMNYDELCEKFESITLNISNASMKDKGIIKKFNYSFFDELMKNDKIIINNKHNLSFILTELIAQDMDFKSFIKKLEIRTANDIKFIVGCFYNIENTKMPQFLKTFVMRSFETLVHSYGLKSQNVWQFVSQNKEFFQTLEFRLIPSSKRYKHYPKAQLFFEKIRERDYSYNQLSKILSIEDSTFELMFDKYYEYNPTFAYKNIVKLSKHPFEAEDILDEYFAQHLPKSSRSLAQAITGILKHLRRNSAYAYNGKFFIKPQSKRFKTILDEFNDAIDAERDKRLIRILKILVEDVYVQKISDNADIFKF